MNKVLHISPHIGGGVGRVLYNYLIHQKSNNRFQHEIACLERISFSQRNLLEKIPIVINDNCFFDIEKILYSVAQADIVIIHWWNHPLLFDFLVRYSLPPCRLIIWSHVSGLTPPNVFSRNVLKYPDIFVFSTPVSFQCQEIKCLSEFERSGLHVVWSTAGVEHVDVKEKSISSSFTVGYIGTVDYVKIHPDFLDFCEAIPISNIKFIVCGGDAQEIIKKENNARRKPLPIEFTGPVDDINTYLSQFDVFGYPLAPYHYGTCDQVLAESMAAGIVPVVLNNKMESFIIEDGKTGIVVKDKQEYGDAIHSLFLNNKFRFELSKNAQVFAKKNFTLDKLSQSWDDIFERILGISKSKKLWNIYSKRIEPAQVFLQSLGEYKTPFHDAYFANDQKTRCLAEREIKKLKSQSNWAAKTKGTARHYHHFFPEDKSLTAWASMLEA